MIFSPERPQLYPFQIDVETFCTIKISFFLFYIIIKILVYLNV